MPETGSPPQVAPIKSEATLAPDFIDRRQQGLNARVEQARWLLTRHKDVIEQHDLQVPENLKDSPDYLDNMLYFYHVHAEVTRRFHPDLKHKDIPEVIEHAIESAIPYTESQRKRKVAEDFHPKAHDPEKGLEFLTQKALEREAAEYLRKVAKDPTHHKAGVAMTDICDFKLFNSLHNEEIGDNAIKNVALGITRALRPEDLKGKIGGDEDAVLIEDRIADPNSPTLKDLPSSQHPAERMRKEVGKTREYDSPTVNVTVGYSDIRPGETFQDGLKRASDAKKVGNLIPTMTPEPGEELKSIKNRAIVARIDLGSDIYEDITDGNVMQYIVTRDQEGYFSQVYRKASSATHPDMVWDVVRPEGQKMVLANARQFQHPHV